MSVIVVGNSSNLIGSGLGNRIDSFDKVVRFNEFAITEEYIRDVGKKVTHWGVASLRKFYRFIDTVDISLLEKIWCLDENRWHLGTGKGALSKNMLNKKQYIDKLLNKVEPYPYFVRLICRRLLGILPSSGFSTILSCLLLYGPPIHIVGFSDFNNSEEESFYGKYFMPDKKAVNIHSFIKETKYRRLLMGCGEIIDLGVK